jgi:hypothetical protein
MNALEDDRKADVERARVAVAAGETVTGIAHARTTTLGRDIGRRVERRRTVGGTAIGTARVAPDDRIEYARIENALRERAERSVAAFLRRLAAASDVRVSAEAGNAKVERTGLRVVTITGSGARLAAVGASAIDERTVASAVIPAA